MSLNLPPRPLIASRGSAIETISIFLEIELKLLAERNPFFILDTLDFLLKVQDVRIGTNTLMVTIDVELLYSAPPQVLYYTSPGCS